MRPPAPLGMRRQPTPHPGRAEAMRPSGFVSAAVRQASAQRKLDRFLTGDAVVRAAAATEPIKPPVCATVTLKVQAWDGNVPMMPLIALEYVPKQLRIYPDRHASAPLPDNHPPPAADDDGADDALLDAPCVGPAGAVERRMRSLADLRALAKASLLHEIASHPTFAHIRRRAERRRSARLEPPGPRLALREPSALRFHYLGTRIRDRDEHDDACCCARGLRVRRVKDVMRLSPQFGVGWTECTLDLPLNRAAELHLASRRYEATYTFSARVDAVELARPATEDAPFGLAPSTYVSIEHGRTLRYSHIERETRAPNFEWLAGSIPFEPGEPLKLRVFMAKRLAICPRADALIGQLWLDAPLLPLPRGLSHPEMLALSLGTNVGVVHLSLRGPAVRRSTVDGCACWCGDGCLVPICGSPPCVPSASVAAARALSCWWRSATSRECKAAAATGCCCCLALGAGALAASGAADGGRTVLDVTSGLRSTQAALSAAPDLELS